MKRVIAAVSLTVAGLAALLGFKTRDASSEAAAPTTTTIGQPAVTTTGGGTPAEPTTTTAAGAATTAAPATVQVDGPVVDTRYGPVQVAVVVADGVLVDVVALQLPSGDRESDQISEYAAPRLEEMALAAQSAEIDVVSGATFTSRAYADSLQAALDEVGM
ncbi:MAG: FMN-binding protein [Acidimicrobiia bacterium]|jgi:uncharacterized protein with FMN-binding domain|nr:FMN-binding protein [Acidimicrobiia bacterium]